MDLRAEKFEVMEKIMHLADSALLKKINDLLEAEMIVGYTTGGAPLTMMAYNARLEAGERQIEAGDFSTQEDLEKESSDW